MAKSNTPLILAPIKTHEGAPAKRITALEQLNRCLMGLMLFENSNTYETGHEQAKNLADAVSKVDAKTVMERAIYARSFMNLRHAPLYCVVIMSQLITHKHLVADALEAVIQRPDELMEFCAMVQKLPVNKGKALSKCLSNQMKKGLARAFLTFKEYTLSKYDKGEGAVKLKDILFLCHVKGNKGVRGYTKNSRKLGISTPLDEKSQLFKKVAESTLPSIDTWETVMSQSKDKKADWLRLLKPADRSKGEFEKLGGIALIRNFAHMERDGVPHDVIKAAVKRMSTGRILPFRFFAAAKRARWAEAELEEKMLQCMKGVEKIPGTTVLLVDVSCSMDANMSGKSEMTYLEAACALAVLLRELCDEVRIITFSNTHVEVGSSRRGFALRDAIVTSQRHGGTHLGEAVKYVDNSVPYNTMFVFTDEQSHDPVPNPKGLAYMINVATNKNGVGYKGNWVHIDGFSAAVPMFAIEHMKSIGVLKNDFGKETWSTFETED
jgi:hypothetical protein